MSDKIPAYLNNAIERISNAYEAIKVLGSGKNGITILIMNRNNGIFFCLKASREDGGQDTQSLRLKLKKEIQILSSLNHISIPKIYEDGTDFTTPYYICTFHPGRTLYEFAKSNRSLTFEESVFFMSSILNVFRYIHEHGRTHCDAHFDNIMISEDIYEHGVMLIDFGSGHRNSDSNVDTEDRGNFGFKDLLGQERHQGIVNRNEAHPDFMNSDFSAIGKAFKRFKNLIISKSDIEKQSAFNDFCAYLQSIEINKDWRTVMRKFSKMIDPNILYNSTKWIFENNDELSVYNIPIWGRMQASDAISAIIDTDEFQRLRGVKQLSFCDWEFPGATHSRYEHSIGVLAAAKAAMKEVSLNKYFRDRFDQIDINGFYLSALLHDIGHYPFAHMIEHYIASRADGNRALSNCVNHTKFSKDIVNSNDQIKSTIESHFGSNGLISFNRFFEKNANGAPKMGAAALLLDSSIDCDKIDYLKRDALHCGLDWASGFNAYEIFRNIAISKDASEIFICEGGIPNIEGFLVAQSQMLSGVYWNPKVRSIVATFHRFLDILIGKDISSAAKNNSQIPPEILIKLIDLLRSSSSEREAILKLIDMYREKQKMAGLPINEKHLALINIQSMQSNSSIYREVCRFSFIESRIEGNTSGADVYKRLMNTAFTDGGSQTAIAWSEIGRLRNCFISAMKSKMPASSNIDSAEILIDIPWGKRKSSYIKAVNNINDLIEIDITDLTHLKKSIFMEPSIYCAPIRIFSAPELYHLLRANMNSIRRDAIEQFMEPIRNMDEEEVF